ncbi:MAG: O-antigen ligase family protein [Thermoleophilaceae bacterium]
MVVLVLAGALLALAAVSYDAERPLYGGSALSLLALLTIFTGLSMSWSVAPDLSLQELGRTLTYLAVFAVAIMGARQFRGSGRSLLAGILLTGLAVCLWALATRVFPGAIGEQVLGARLGAPFDYWNALGGMAALCVPGALWLGSRHDVHRIASMLAYPALGVLLLTVLLTQSRGALAAAVIAAIGWFVFVPLRLRTAPVVGVAVVAIAPIAAWALSKDAFTAALQPLSVRESVAGSFGLILVATLVVLAGAGIVAVRLRDRTTLSMSARRKSGLALAGVAALLALSGLAVFAGSGGGIEGRLVQLTADKSTVAGSGAGRLGSTSSSRGEYWREAFDVFKDRPVVGSGADGFTLARLQYRNDPRSASHAHGFIPQTMADLDLLGTLLVLLLLVAWAVAAARAMGIRRRGATPLEWTPDRIVLTGLGLCVLAYGLQSAIDWTWFIPGPTVAAIAAAGFLAGRGPLRDDATAQSPAVRISRDPLRMIAAAAIAITALLSAWAVWQPQRSTTAVEQAITLSDKGQDAAAIAQANRAREIDPYSAEPLYAKATAITAAGRPRLAYRVLEQAVAEHPRDPDTWLRLSQFELTELDLPTRALESANAAFSIDPKSPRVNVIAAAARTAIAASTIPPPPPAP